MAPTEKLTVDDPQITELMSDAIESYHGTQDRQRIAGQIRSFVQREVKEVNRQIQASSIPIETAREKFANSLRTLMENIDEYDDESGEYFGENLVQYW